MLLSAVAEHRAHAFAINLMRSRSLHRYGCGKTLPQSLASQCPCPSRRDFYISTRLTIYKGITEPTIRRVTLVWVLERACNGKRLRKSLAYELRKFENDQ